MITQIILLFSFEVIKWILIALVVAIPCAWYGVNKWLQSFAYQVDINFWVFLVAGALAFLIAMLTISYQAIKAARTNPVDTLRYE